MSRRQISSVVKKPDLHIPSLPDPPGTAACLAKRID
jgi:hypothetical protein